MSGDRRPRIGPFEIGELIGTGGFASVYRAYDERLNCDVAIKILADNHALNPDVRERFIREAQALRQIDSPSVVSLYDIGETADGRPYLVIEFADRGGLMDRRRQRVAEGWQAGTGDVGYLIDALAAALHPIHAEQLVHRDVTPSNVLIRSASHSGTDTKSSLFASDERLMLSDLGLVKDLLAGSGLTAGSGTAGFAAPEQQHALTTIDGRSDVYSATAVVLWLITGQSPRTVGDVKGLLNQEGWPRPFVEALLRGLADQPEGRHNTVGEWKTDLLSALPLNESDLPAPGLGGRSHNRRSRGLRLIGYAAAGLLVVAGAAGAAFALRPDGSDQTSDESLGSIASTSADADQTEGVASPTPDLQHFYFASQDDRTILVAVWGAQEVPSNVVGTDVAILVDDGDWAIEKRADHHSARDWQLYSTETGTEERRPVTTDSDYVARVRWVLDDDTVTDWSRQLTVAPPS